MPKRFVDGVPARRRLMVWGAILGPGFLTRNPYASFAALPLAVMAVADGARGVIIAAAIGFGHACGRALALSRDATRAGSADYLESVRISMRCRIADGGALLVMTGVAISIIAGA